MKKIFALILAWMCATGLIGCSSSSADAPIEQKTPIFETENIVHIAFYSTVPDGKETAVPDEHLAEITAWLGSFVAGKAVEDVLPPGADSLFVRIEYADGTMVENSTSTVVIDGTTYLINYDKEPACYFELFADRDSLIYGSTHDPDADNSEYGLTGGGEELEPTAENGADEFEYPICFYP